MVLVKDRSLLLAHLKRVTVFGVIGRKNHMPSVEEIKSDDWPECDHCDNPAAYFNFHVGCYSCGGLDCGDTSYVGFYCAQDARFFHVDNRIPLVLSEPVDYLYDRFFEECSTR